MGIDINVQAVQAGVFEIHLFALPLNPTEEQAAKFSKDCGECGMKGLLLYLDYEDKGFTGVLQSSAYCRGLPDSMALMQKQITHLEGCGWTIIRHKVEATASNEGIPITDADASAVGGYFESHISVARADNVAIENEDVVKLRNAAQTMAAQFKTRVPLSYNALKPGQRFLNTRFYGGRTEFYAFQEAVEKAINETGTLKCLKNIREYIVYDTAKAVDAGWVDPPIAA